MRRFTPIKILAVALTSTLAGAPALAGGAECAAAQAAKDHELEELRAELFQTKPEVALGESRDHFRPLCDADGFPLVGNLMRKGPSLIQPSAYCAEIRKLATR